MKDVIAVASVSDQQEHVLLWLNSLSRMMRWDDPFIDRVQLAVMEAVANAMEHGNGWEASKKALIRCSASPELVVFEIEDEGQGYAEAQRNFALPDAFSDGGRGLFLMRQLADDLQFISKGIQLSFNRAEPPNVAPQ